MPASGLRDSVGPQRSTTSVTARKRRVHRSRVPALPGTAPKLLRCGDSPGWEALQSWPSRTLHISGKSGQKMKWEHPKPVETRMGIGFAGFLGPTA